MSPVYLLDCECGRSVEIRRQQAGSQVTCPGCNKAITVPTFRELAKLPMVHVGTRKQSSWSREEGLLFSIGLPLLLLGGTVFGYFGYQKSQLLTERPTLEEEKARIGATDAAIVKLTPLETWEMWKNYRHLQTYRFREPFYESNRKLASRDNLFMILGVMLGAIGLVCFVALLVVGRAKRSKPG